MFTIGIVAGEASGDLLGASLIRDLKEKYPNCRVSGIGGPALQAEGCQSLFPMQALSVMGIVEVIKHLLPLLGIRRKLKRYFLDSPPDVFIGIDAPDFNLPLERFLRKHGIKTVHYVSPSVWAWRESRVKGIRKSVDLMLTLFPFEKDYFDRNNIAALCTGHPLAKQFPMLSDSQKARQELKLSDKAITVAILPGSRYGEIGRLSEPFLDACKILQSSISEVCFISSFLDQSSRDLFLQKKDSGDYQIRINTYINQSRAVMTAADVVLVASGTAALEVMLAKKPMVVAYKVNKLTGMLIKFLLKVPYVSLPNLLANEELVPEHLQEDCHGERLAESLLFWLNNQAACDSLLRKFDQLHQELLEPQSHNVAEEILTLAKK